MNENGEIEWETNTIELVILGIVQKILQEEESEVKRRLHFPS